MSLTPTPSISIASDMFSNATTQVIANVGAQLRPEIDRLIHETERAEEERALAVEKLASVRKELEQCTKQVETLRKSAYHPSSEPSLSAVQMTLVKQQATTIEQLQREVAHWRAHAQNWKDHFLRVEEDRCALASGLLFPSSSPVSGNAGTLVSTPRSGSTVTVETVPEHSSLLGSVIRRRPRKVIDYTILDKGVGRIESDSDPDTSPSTTNQNKRKRPDTDSPTSNARPIGRPKTGAPGSQHAHLKRALADHNLVLSDVSVTHDGRWICPFPPCTHVAIGHSSNLARHLETTAHNPFVYMCLAVGCFKQSAVEITLARHLEKAEFRDHKTEHNAARRRGVPCKLRKEVVEDVKRALEGFAMG